MVLAPKQTHRSMEQNKEPRKEHTLTWVINFLTRVYNGEKTASSINCVGKTGQLHEKESNWTILSHHVQK